MVAKYFLISSQRFNKYMCSPISFPKSGKITVPLATEGQLNPSGNNVEFVQQYVAKLLKTAFPHFTDAQVCIDIVFEHEEITFCSHY